MDVIQRLIHYFAVVRRKARQHRRMVTTIAAVVVFATTYALILPAITLDADTANDTPGIELQSADVAEQDEPTVSDEATTSEPEEPAATDEATTTEEPKVSEAEPSATESTEPTTDATSTEAGANETPSTDSSTETPAATDEKPIVEDGTTLTTTKENDYTVTATVNADSGFHDGTTIDAKEIDPNSAEYQDYYNKALAKVQADNPDVTELQSARFFDITFTDGEDQDAQPHSDVKVDIDLAQPMSVDNAWNVKVIHIDDKVEDADAATSVVDDDKTEPAVTEDDQLTGVTFQADSFSVYGIVETSDTSKTKVTRRTYTFLNDDGSAYNFTLNPNPAGGSTQSTNTQIVKNGDTLQAVGTPEAKKTESQGKEFLGWKVTAVSSDVTGLEVGNVIQLPQTISGIAQDNTDETVTLQAVFDDAVYLTFYDSDNTTVIYHDKVAKNAVVNLSSYHAAAEIPASGNQMVKSFVGWNTTQNAEEKLDDSYSVNGQDATFYPVYKEGYWLYFNANDSDNDVKASFTESKFIDKAVTDSSDKPTDPQRQGYTFGGWYTDQACTQEFNFNNTTLTGNTTVYAKWTPATTTYTVVVWRQQIGDDKNAQDSAKTYDYGESFQVSATTGDVISSSTDLYSGTGYNRQNLKSLSGDNYTGFHYAATGVSRTDSTTTVTVKGDGSSVINVYYDRDLITMNFQYSGGTQYTYTEVSNPNSSSRTTYYGYLTGDYGWSGEYVELYYSTYYNEWRFQYGNYSYSYSTYGNGKYYTRTSQYVQAHTETFTGLYGQQLSKYDYSWPASDGPWCYVYGSGRDTNYMYMSFLGQFVLPGDQTGTGNSSTTITFTQNSTVDKTYYFYLQNADGTWPSTPNSTGSGADGVGTFNFSEKFDNFNVSGYQLNNGGRGGDYGTWQSTQAGSSVSVSNASSLGVRYTRKSYNVEFYNGSTHLDADQSKLYEASLSGLTTPAASSLTYPGNEAEANSYTFVGWFADPECTTYVSFGSALSEEEQNRLKNTYPDITNFVTYETMPGHNLPVYAGWKAIRHTVTFDPQGGTIPGSAANTNYVESVLLGHTIRNSTQSNVLQTTYTDDKGVTYTLIGWYKTNDDGTETLFNFSDSITADITLKAHWRQSGQFYVRYVDNDTAATLLQDDTIAYADQSNVKVMSWPSGKTVKDGYVFAGWIYEGKTYVPGETILMDANKATDVDGKKTITLVASYTQLGTTFIRYDANGGSGTLTDPSGISNNTQANIKLNSSTTLSKGTGFTRDGYVLVGWNSDQTKATNGEIEWNLGEKVGEDGDTGNTLYAVWHKPDSLKKVDQKNQDTALSGAAFKLTKKSGETFVNVAASDFYGSVTVGNDGYSVTTGNDGTVQLGTLKAGTYKLTETTAPAGYVISTDDVTFTVGADGKVTLSGSPSNASVSTDGLTITITNTAGTALPNTGGSGSLPFLLGGSALITTAIVGFALRRRNEGRGV